jgi:hypothetical protein
VTRVEWTHTIETSQFLRALAVGAFSAIGAVFVAGAALLAVVVTSLVLAGAVAALVAGAALTALFSRRLVAQAALLEHREAFLEPLSTRAVVAASAVWAAGDVLALAAGVPLAAVAAVHAAAVFVGLPVAAFLRSEGAVDTDAGTLTANGRDTTLAAIAAVSRYSLGPATVLRVRYHDGAAGASDPRWLGVLPTDADRVADALEASDAPPPDSNAQPLVAAVLGVFGFGILSFAAYLGYVAATGTGDQTVVVGYATLVTAVFAAVFLWLAVREW